ncbi:hypothetical protein DL766_006412 [Monosporascus sp. MC13-8B]|uniref:Uncharacterized protein n=1 Tax=Monosporascus cannonballus TaxID=155416 RepID=A0ABY0GTK7_9PEZI|nr:hypothetical protein DL763_010435 [Monosporascus cannonballus]RYO77105.1 hypothetical protein DL762_009471 [Monosporascus cannonballus]RYP27415.1 hypothetical protein DL766_006412 [Monosporascus sp. MC13-8B]
MASEQHVRGRAAWLAPDPPKLPYRVFRPAQPEFHSRRIRHMFPDGGIPDYYDDNAERPDVYLQATEGDESPATYDHGTIAAARDTQPSHHICASAHELAAGRAGSLEICVVAVGVCLLTALLARVFWMMALAVQDGGARLPPPSRDGFDGRGESYLSKIGASTGRFVGSGAELAAGFGDDVVRRRRRNAFLRRLADDAEV